MSESDDFDLIDDEELEKKLNSKAKMLEAGNMTSNNPVKPNPNHKKEFLKFAESDDEDGFSDDDSNSTKPIAKPSTSQTTKIQTISPADFEKNMKNPASTLSNVQKKPDLSMFAESDDSFDDSPRDKPIVQSQQKQNQQAPLGKMKTISLEDFDKSIKVKSGKPLSSPVAVSKPLSSSVAASKLVGGPAQIGIFHWIEFDRIFAFYIYT